MEAVLDLVLRNLREPPEFSGKGIRIAGASLPAASAFAMILEISADSISDCLSGLGGAWTEYLNIGDILRVTAAQARLSTDWEEFTAMSILLSQDVVWTEIRAAISQAERREELDAEDRRRDISRKTRSGLDAARARGRVRGRPTVIDADKRAAIIARRSRNESIREIARGVGVSPATVHRVLGEPVD